jgi:opacity protein-like surface antigen
LVKLVSHNVGFCVLTNGPTIKSEDRFYKKSQNNKFKNGVSYSLGIGYKFNDKFRSDIVYNGINNLKYSVNNVTINNIKPNFKQKMNINAVMANVYFDIPFEFKIKPYLGIGIGYANINPENTSLTHVGGKKISSYSANKSNNFTYALMTGGSFNITEKFSLDVGYKFQDFGKAHNFSKKKGARCRLAKSKNIAL